MLDMLTSDYLHEFVWLIKTMIKKHKKNLNIFCMSFAMNYVLVVLWFGPSDTRSEWIQYILLNHKYPRDGRC